MERSAARAHARGGAAAAAAFLQRATELTPDPARRSMRALAAAQAELVAGAPDSASELLATAERGVLDDLQLATLERLRAQLAFSLRRGNDAPPLLLSAAKRLAPLDASQARETYLDALGAAIFAGRLSRGGGVREVAEAAGAAPAAARPPRSTDLLLDGLATRFTKGYAAGVPQLQRALRALVRHDGRTRRIFAGFGWVVASPRICGTTSGGMSWPRCRFGGLAMPVRSTSCRLRSPIAPAYACTPGSSRRQRHLSRRRT